MCSRVVQFLNTTLFVRLSVRTVAFNKAEDKEESKKKKHEQLAF